MDKCAFEPVIDEAGLQSMRQTIGLDAFMEVMFESLADIRKSSARLAVAAEQADPGGVRRAAHMLTGVFSQFGCPQAACVTRYVAEGLDDYVLNAAREALAAASEAEKRLQAWISRS